MDELGYEAINLLLDLRDSTKNNISQDLVERTATYEGARSFLVLRGASAQAHSLPAEKHLADG
jgi:hypothetical protein